MKIIRDTREKLEHGWSFGDFDVIDKKLDTGDYTLVNLEKILCIERKKSPGEVAGNIGKDRERFNKELVRMSKFELAYIICEFTLEDALRFPEGSDIPKKLRSYVRVGGKFIVKSLSSYEELYGIKVIYAGNRGEAIEKAIEILEGAAEKYNV